jgi:hypothetical protein
MEPDVLFMLSVLSLAIISTEKVEKILLIFIPLYAGFNFICMYAQNYKITIYTTVPTAKKRQKSLFLLILPNTIDANSSWRS